VDLREPPRPDPPESIVPMINVVFLLLIFFLMTARIAPPDPFGVEPPESTAGGPGAAPLVLQVSDAGEIAYGAARGEAAVEAIAADAAGEPVTVRAGAALPGQDLARILAELAGGGVETIELATIAP
jgi:biopolymer transport protein ExbD